MVSNPARAYRPIRVLIRWLGRLETFSCTYMGRFCLRGKPQELWFASHQSIVESKVMALRPLERLVLDAN